MVFKFTSLLLIASVIASPVGCRQAASPTFSPGPEVVALTEDIDDSEELQLFEDLQVQLADLLRQLTGTPDKPILLGTEATTDKLQHGYSIYAKYCTQCHGVNGDGPATSTEHLMARARNCARGLFKFTAAP